MSSQPQAAPAFHARHGITANEYQADFNIFSQQGYRIQSLSVYGGGDPRYAVVWIKHAGAAWQACHGRDAAGYQAFFNEWTGKGYVPHIVTATGSGSSAVFAAVFEKVTVSGWFARHGIDQAAFDQANKDAHTNGQILISAAVYGTAAHRLYAGIWMPNTGNVQWLVHLDANGTDYQTWFDGATQIPMRPAFVIPSEDHAYLSVFRDDSVGGWDARHGLSAADYQQAFDQFAGQGELPLDVHGGGSGSNARYAAVFARKVDPIARAWTVIGAAGPHAAALDAAVKAFMQRWGIRSGTVAVAKSNSVKLARAYTWAEPGYAVTQPDSEFRVASVSKAFTCAAIKTLADANKLKLTDKVFPTLGITKVALAGQTADAHINDITIQNLVDHAGGWLPDASGGFHPEFNLRKISTDMGLSGPPSKTDMARYMFGMPLQFQPGMKDYGSTKGASYSNFGYILLGLIVEHHAGQTYADYVRQHVLAALSVTDLHLARTLANQKAADEVHYHSANLGNPSYKASSLALVPGAYGGSGYMTETMDSGGGLMATGSALARFATVWASWGLGGPGGARTGGMAGTVSRIQYSGGNVAFSFAFNTADSIGAKPAGSDTSFIDQFGNDLGTTIAGLAW
jgi:CubicO group peptidase (beta-lactamase class C family)